MPDDRVEQPWPVQHDYIDPSGVEWVHEGWRADCAVCPELVVSIDDMDDETFLQHMDARHFSEVRDGPLATHPGRSQGWIAPYRAFHDRSHRHTATEHEHQQW